MERKNDSALIIKEPEFKTKSFVLDLVIDSHTLKGIIDTGAVYNFISTEHAERLQKRDCIKEKKSIVQLADGSSGDILGEIELSFCIEGFQKQQYTEIFQVMKSKLDLVILGGNFMQKNSVVINYKNMKITINEHIHSIEPEMDEKWTSTPDAKISEHVMMIDNTQSKCLIDNITNRVLKYKQNNPVLGTIPNETMQIILTSNETVTSKPYPIPFKIQNEVNVEIKRLLKEGIIKPSKSNYSSPAFPVLKRNGNIRLVVDYRKLNSITKKETYPFPNVWDEVRSIPKSNYFSQIDMCNGYHQLLLSKESRKFTAFVVPGGLYEYTRVPFGLANAPRIFQNVMRKLLGHLNFVRIFLDDILIFSTTIFEHETHIKTVLDILEMNNIGIGFEKSKFCSNSVKYLGFNITTNGFGPDTSRVSEFKQMPPPKTRRQLLKILGFINWFRPFIKNLSTIIVKLTDKTRHIKERFEWTNEDQNIINLIYEKIETAALLSYPNYNENFSLDVDASDRGVGGVLYQSNRLVGIFSKKFSKTQRNYTITEKEFFAIYLALEHFKKIVYGSHIEIYTDHSNLLYDTNVESSRVNRWKLILEDFSITLNYRKGDMNIAADTLSRVLYLNSHLNKIGDYIYEIQQSEILQISENSTTKGTIQEIVNGKNFILDDKRRVLIPENRSKEVLNFLHKEMQHPGINSLYKSISKYYSIKKIKSQISDVVSECGKCQQFRRVVYGYGEIKGNIASEHPFQNISTDIYGPVPTSIFQGNENRSDKFWILTITDRATRWSEAFKLKKIQSNPVEEILKQWFLKHGVPVSILSDNGTQFTSLKLKKLAISYGIRQIFATPFNPTGNAISERINQKITDVIRKNMNRTIKTVMGYINFALQNTYNRIIQSSPNEIVNKFSYVDPLKRTLEVDMKAIYNAQLKFLKKDVFRKNSKRFITVLFEPGDFVYLKNPNKKSKFDVLWNGPFLVVKANHDKNIFELQLHDGKTIRANLKQLRPSKGRGKCRSI
ncbi:MAG: reverse transcriptase domain-containing protein [Aeromonas sp.]